MGLRYFRRMRPPMREGLVGANELREHGKNGLRAMQPTSPGRFVQREAG
jgi:hypothetical protein